MSWSQNEAFDVWDKEGNGYLYYDGRWVCAYYDWWNAHYDWSNFELKSYITDSIGKKYASYFDANWVNEDGTMGDRKEEDELIIVKTDITAYQSFATNIEDADGHVMQKNEDTVLVQENNRIDGLYFSKFIADNHEYNTDNSKASIHGFKDASTEQTWDFKVKFKGTSDWISSSTLNAKIKDEKGNEVEIKNILAGNKYSITWSNSSYNNKEVEKVKFVSTYYTFKGRIIVLGIPEGTSQSRIITDGKKIQVTDELEFNVEEDTYYPILVLKKQDYLNHNLTGAKFSATIEKDGNSQTLTNLTTNASGEVTIYSDKVTDFKLGNLYKTGGTLKITLKETTAPDGYTLLGEDIVVDITYQSNGTVTATTKSNKASKDVISLTYNDKKGNSKTTNVTKLTVKDKEVKLPVIVLQKTDYSGSALKGATFDVTIEKGKNSETLTGLKTNDNGIIQIFTTDLKTLQLGNMYKTGGTLKITLKETAAPEGYDLISGDLVINATYNSNGTIKAKSSNSEVVTSVAKLAYYNDSGVGTKENTIIVKVKDTKSSRIRIRKVDGDTENQDYLPGASFTAYVIANATTKQTTQTVDSKGYIDITSTVNEAVGAIGKYTGNIQVTLQEKNNPSGYIKMNQNVTVTLAYKNGYLTNVTYPNNDNNLSKDVIDVGESEDRKDVTIAVKNTKSELQPIFISKVDSQTGVALSNVDFNVTISNGEITDKSKSIVYKTDDDGLITIDKEALSEIGLTNNYNGKLYILVEEAASKPGYRKLAEKVDIEVEYNNGNITRANKISGPTSCTVNIATNNNAKMLKIVVPNEREIPELVISKETLSNLLSEKITSANLSVKVTASGKTGQLNKSTVVNKNGQITFTSSELGTLGIDGTYSGNITVEISETSVESGVLVLPEKVTVTLTIQNGRYVNGSTTNGAHTTIVNNVSYIDVKVLDTGTVTYMPISGIVWQELATTKGAGTLIDGLYTTASDSEYSDRLFEGIEVTLYKKNENSLEFVNVSKGTNPTYTDSNGHYEFQAPVDNGYVVKFTYNGENFRSAPSTEYNPTTQLANWKISSKASELNGSTTTAGTRTYVNNLLSEIGSYPANYEMTTKLFENSKISTTNNLQAAYTAGYNVAYRYEEIKELYTEIATLMKEQLATDQNIDVSTTAGLNKLKDIYIAVAGNHTSDTEIYNKLQYIYDTRVSSYAGYNTNTTGINNFTNIKTYPYTRDTSYQYQQYVNLGLVKRDKTDLSLLKDIYTTSVISNGHNETYNYNNGDSSYTQYLYEEDYNYNVTENSNGTAWYTDNNMDFYVRYKLTVTNSTLTNTSLTEVVDYFDSRFELSGVTAQKVNGNDIEEINNISTGNSKYHASSKIELQNASGYSDLYITFNNAPSIKDNERVEIFVTLKLKDNAIDVFKEGISNLVLNNYAEINGYKTSIGVLDADSKPGTFKVKEYEDARQAYVNAYANRNSNKQAFAEALRNLTRVREDDAWKVELVFSNGGTDHHRTIKGNVWNAISDEVKTSADLKGDTILTYVREKGIEGIIVELVELNAGNQIVRAKTITNSEGEYTLSQFIPGDYVIRFIYGAKTRTGYTDEQNSTIAQTSKVYNGQKYQSTKANPNTDNDVYWYANTDVRYSDAYDDAYSRVGEGNGFAQIEYDYTKVLEMEQNSDKTIYAYTSRIVAEVENAQTEVDGTVPQVYNIENIDFGLTPRAKEDLELEKYVSNIKVYLQNGVLQLDANIDENGQVTYLNDPTYTNIVNVIGATNTYRDGLIETLIDEELLNGATLEITYTVKLNNNSEDGSFNLIYSIGKDTVPVAVTYYGEDYKTLPSYEGETQTIMYHDNTTEQYSLETYSSQRTIESITTVKDMVDYIDPNLTFIGVNKAGEIVNSDWMITSANTFNSSRKNNTQLMAAYNMLIKPSSNSILFSTVERGRSTSTTLTLSTVLSTSSTETNDYEYSNLIEITKLHNNIGRIVDIEGYDIIGKDMPETSRVVLIEEIKNNIYPTLGTAKSETIEIHAPTGLSKMQEIGANTLIALISLTVLAGGIVLIKKRVLAYK